MTRAIPGPFSRERKGVFRRRVTVGLVMVGVSALVAVITVDRVGRREEQRRTDPAKRVAASTTAAGSRSTTAAPSGHSALPLRGVPLEGPTGLQLLIADVPPFVLDLDRGSAQRITGLATAQRRQRRADGRRRARTVTPLL